MDACSLAPVIRNEDMLSLPATDVTPSQTTGFILTTPDICRTALARVNTLYYKPLLMCHQIHYVSLDRKILMYVLLRETKLNIAKLWSGSTSIHEFIITEGF